MKIPNKFLGELLNVQEMYEENLMNEDGDCFARIQDSYANEMLEQDLETVFGHCLFQEFKDLNNLLEGINTEKEEEELDEKIYWSIFELIQDHNDLKKHFTLIQNKVDDYEI